ncbi:uncharacterized protein LOC124167497 isoform X3 [Ischnura elegans]|uniref:uncharacterized protein LOC124167497 isoform X3 n=1 Tax=Ischnura elegans TaxID=197161 RepID=UPI001ED88AF9|nr:uncharacterized protein LOC124167497 isoform X3 [Ischnura elegans]
MHLHIRLGHFGSEPAMSKVNKEQKEMLLEFIEANKDLAKGKFSTPQGAKDAVRLWEEAAVKLNACGVRKSWKEWRKCWHDLKTATKGKVAALALEGKRTGGGPPAEEELQDFHKRVYALIGSNAVLGHQNTCESRVMVLGEEIGDLIYLPQHNPSSASTSTIHMYTTPITPTSPSTTISAAPNISIPCPSETDPDSIVPEPTPNLPTPTALRTITLPTVESIGAKDTPQRKMRQENSTTQPVKKMAAEQLIEVEREKMVLEKRRMLAEERGIALEEEKVAIKRRKMELEEERVTRSDGYPQTVCSSCLDKLTDFKMFKEQCKGSMAAFENGFHPDKFNFVDGPETVAGSLHSRLPWPSIHCGSLWLLFSTWDSASFISTTAVPTDIVTDLWSCVQPQGQAVSPPQDTQRREAVPVPHVPQVLLPQRLPAHALQDCAPGRGSVEIPLLGVRHGVWQRQGPLGTHTDCTLLVC